MPEYLDTAQQVRQVALEHALRFVSTPALDPTAADLIKVAQAIEAYISGGS